jgi:uncharacterized protein
MFQVPSSKPSNLELGTNFDKLFLVQTEENIDYDSPEWKELYEYERARADLPPTPNNPPWNSLIAFGVWVFSVLMIFFLPAFFVLPFAAGQNIVLTDGAALTEFLTKDANAILVQLIAIVPAHILTLVLAWFVVTANRRHSFRETLGWSNGGFRWYYHILIVVGFFALAAVVSQFLPEQDNDLLRVLRSSYAATVAVALMATFTAPLVEEVVYRGVLYSAFQRSLGVSGAVVLVTFLFALVHVPQYWGSPGTILLICLLSLVLTLVRVKTDNLLPCIILHTIFNGLQSVVLVLQPYLPETPPTTQEAVSFFLHLPALN